MDLRGFSSTIHRNDLGCSYDFLTALPGSINFDVGPMNEFDMLNTNIDLTLQKVTLRY